MRSRRRRLLLGEEGAVAAEFAVALPAVILVVLLGVGALGAGARQVRLQDAAADAARLIARGEEEGRAVALVATVGGVASVEDRGELVCVRVHAPPALPGLPPAAAQACALSGGR